jgi:hypothetical protein
VTVAWSSSEDIRLVNLLYSLDNGHTFAYIVRYAANMGQYAWTTPSLSIDSSVMLLIEGTSGTGILANDIVDFTLSLEYVEPPVLEDPVEEVPEVPVEEDLSDEGILSSDVPLEVTFGARWLADAAEDQAILAMFGTFPTGVSVDSLIKLPDDGDVSTQYDSAVYFVGSDNRRHPFPNAPVYESWFSSFDAISIVDAETMAAIPLGSMITYRPASTLVKFTTVPKTYAVDEQACLEWITTEAVAEQLYGKAWSDLVSDVSDAFWSSYCFGQDIR